MQKRSQYIPNIKLSGKKDKISQLILVIANNFFEFFAILLLTKIAAMYLTKADYGFYSLVLSVYTFLSILPFLSMHSAVERYAVEYISEGKFQKNFVYLLAIHVPFFAIYFVLILVFGNFLPENWKNIMLFLYLYVWSKVYRAILVVILNVQKNRVRLLIMRIIELVVLLACLYFGMKNNAINAELFINSSTISSIVAIAVILILERMNIQFKSFKMDQYLPILKQILHFSYPFIIWGIFLWFQNMIGRWYLEALASKSVVANYSLMASLALVPASAFIAIVSNFFVPIAYAKEIEEHGFIGKMNKKLLVFSVIFWMLVLLIFSIFKNQFILLLLDAKYLDVAWSLPYFVFGAGMYAIGQITIFEIYFYKKAKLLIASNVLPGIFALIASYFLIKKWGFNGAVFSNVATYTLSGVITLLTTMMFTKNNQYA